MIDGGDALKGLVTIIGSGGLVTIIGAFLAFRSEAHKGRRGDPEPATVNVSGPVVTAGDVELLTNAISDLAGAAIQIAAHMKLSYETEKHDREVAEEAEMRLLRDSFEAQRQRDRSTPPRR